jgi:hypothetical protein
MMKAIGNILVSLSLLSTQMPVLMIFRQDDFIPPFESGRTLFFIAVEVICTVVFGLVLLERQAFIEQKIKKFRSTIFSLVLLFAFGGVTYSLLFMNFVYRDYTNQQIVVPLMYNNALADLLNNPKSTDVASIYELINMYSYNKVMWLVTYIMFILMYSVLLSSIVLMYAMIGVRLSKTEAKLELEAGIPKKEKIFMDLPVGIAKTEREPEPLNK